MNLPVSNWRRNFIFSKYTFISLSSSYFIGNLYAQNYFSLYSSSYEFKIKTSVRNQKFWIFIFRHCSWIPSKSLWSYVHQSIDVLQTFPLLTMEVTFFESPILALKLSNRRKQMLTRLASFDSCTLIFHMSLVHFWKNFSKHPFSLSFKFLAFYLCCNSV